MFLSAQGLKAGFMVVFVLLSFLAGCVDAKKEPESQKLFEAACSRCHSIDIPRALKRTREEWAMTVSRMRSQNRAELTDREANAIIDYLAKKHGR